MARGKTGAGRRAAAARPKSSMKPAVLTEPEPGGPSSSAAGTPGDGDAPDTDQSIGIRPRPRRARKPVPKVSNEYYVGYVEDDESVEAIMKKFEALERVQSAWREKASEEKDNALKDNAKETADMNEDLRRKMLEEVFTETSMFTPKYAAAAPDLEHEDDLIDFVANEAGKIDFGSGSDEEDSASDYDSSDYEAEHTALGGWRGRRDRGQGARRQRKSGTREMKAFAKARNLRSKLVGTSLTMRALKCFLAQIKYNQTVNPRNDDCPFKPEKLKMPKGEVKFFTRVVPYTPPVPINSPGTRYFEGNILRMTAAKLGNEYQGIYMDPPVLLPGEERVPGKYTVEEFGKMKLQRLFPGRGFLFIWTHKSQTVQWLKVARESWGLHHVETFVWGKRSIGNKMASPEARVPGALLAANCSILLILRYTKVYVELRHQRNCDVHFQSVMPRRPGDLTERKPDWVFHIIETLLPEARWTPEWPNGDRLLYLFAKKDFVRKGWTTVSHIHQEQSAGVDPESMAINETEETEAQPTSLVPSKRAISTERKAGKRKPKGRGRGSRAKR